MSRCIISIIPAALLGPSRCKIDLGMKGRSVNLEQKHPAISPAQTTTFRSCFVGFLFQLSLYVLDFQLTSPSTNVELVDSRSSKPQASQGASIMPKTPEISVGIQMERPVSVLSNRNIHL